MDQLFHSGKLSIQAVLGIASVLCLLILFLKFKWRMRKLEYWASKFPGPPTLPIIGNMHYMLGVTDTTGILEKITNLSKYGKIVRYWNGYELYLLLTDPSSVESLLRSPDAIEKSFVYKFFAGNLGGVFMASKENWHPMRKLLNSTFNPKYMEDYIEAFNSHAETLIDIVKSNENVNIDPRSLLSRCLIDIIIDTHFGVKTNEQKWNTGQVFEAMTRAIEFTLMRCSKPWLFPDFIYKRTSYYQEARKIKNPPSKFFRSVTEECIKRMELITEYDYDNGIKNNCYVDKIFMWVKKRGVHSDVRMLQYMISDIIIAGYDTTATAISHLLYNLAAHPEIQDKVIEELDTILEGKSDSEIDKRDFLQMEYLEMVIKETLRLYSPPFIVRKLHNDLQTEFGTLPAGSSPYVSIYSLHRDPKYWKYPDKFYPEHFLPEVVATRPKYSYIPFSSGPRNCPGKVYSNWATKVIASRLLQKYRVETEVPPEQMKYKFLLMMEPVNEFSIKFVPRHKETDF